MIRRILHPFYVLLLGWLRFDGLWHHPDFLKLWAGQTISQIGSRISREGLPLIAVLLLAATPAEMGVLAALASAPSLVLGLIVGVWIDRLPRRPILIVADLGRFVLLILIPLAALTGHLSLYLIYAITVGVGVLSLVFTVAYEALLPSLVSREHLLEGNTKLATTESLAELGGPALAGLLIQVISAPLAVAVDALSFLVSVFSLSAIRATEPPPPPPDPAVPPAFWLELREGWRVILHHPVLRTLAILQMGRTFFGNFYAALYGLYALRELGLSPATLGIVIAGGGVGSLLGAAFAGSLPRRFGIGPTLVWASLVGSLIALLTPLAGGPSWFAALMLLIPQVFGDGLATIFSINELSLRQTLVPDRCLGRNRVLPLCSCAKPSRSSSGTCMHPHHVSLRLPNAMSKSDSAMQQVNRTLNWQRYLPSLHSVSARSSIGDIIELRIGV